MITESLEIKFGGVNLFIANSRNGKDDVNTKHRNAQDQFVGNHSKL